LKRQSRAAHILLICLIIMGGAVPAATAQNMEQGTQQSISTPNKKYARVTVEVWSDVLCPFCYIGKRQFDAALAQYTGRDSVEVIWRSFQLDPTLETDTTKTLAQSLSASKGWSPEQTQQMMDYVTEMARGVGLEYHMERSVVANSFDAHRLCHLAQPLGRQSAVKERLFAAYFVEGKNIADPAVLAQIGAAEGLDSASVLAMLRSDAESKGVQEDIALAQQFGISGVPFFVFNRAHAISGAQDASAFLKVLVELGEGK
jgi:predicted DsbA family dithiol-disulfide isomerase